MMKRLPLILAAAGLLAGPLMAQGAVTGTFKGANGTVKLTPAPKGVLVHIEASGLKPGWHGLHFHDKGDCSDAAFKSAGAHVHGAAKAVHGLLNPAANESGDLPNLYAAADGTAHAEFFTTSLTLPALRDADGSAVVIHANADDHMTQPIGGAGDRVACAVIR